MGKAKKLKLASQRHAPLGDQIQKDDFAAASSRPSKDGMGRRGKTRKDEDDIDQFVDGKLSGRILSQAREQVMELEAEESSINNTAEKRGVLTNKAVKLSSSVSAAALSSDDDDSDVEGDIDEKCGGNTGGYDGQG